MSDGAANMELMRSKLTDAGFFTFACQAHCLNLVHETIMKDKGRMQVLTQVVFVLKQFRTVHSLSAGLAALGLPRPPLPSNTRWSSQCRSFLYFNSYWAYLTQLAASHFGPREPIRVHLESRDSRDGALHLLKMLSPVASCLAVMEASATTLGMAVVLWLELCDRVRTGLLFQLL